jgi:TRAP-type C4-dicarboxylate transport system permease small subunit
MQALKIIGILIMFSALAATGYVFTRLGTDEIKMSFQEFTGYAVPAFCLGAAMVGIERLTAKITTAQANKPAKKDAPKKEDKAETSKGKK